MDVLLGIVTWFGCFSASIINVPDYMFIKLLNQNSENELSYFFIKIMKRSYNLIYLIGLNIVCFIGQFFVLNNDLRFVLFVINILFFINVFLELLINSYNKNFISLLQQKVTSNIKVSVLFL